MLTVVKFFNNYRKEDPNKLITRTLLKVGVIDRFWSPGPKFVHGDTNKKLVGTSAKEPERDEIWLVDVVTETRPSASGLFILHPIERVREALMLLPDQYTTEKVNGATIVKPNKLDSASRYMLPISLRRKIAGTGTYDARAHAVIVYHGGDMWRGINGKSDSIFKKD